MSFDDLMRDLKARKYAPVYFLYGEEPYSIDLVTDYITKHVLTDAEKSFNQTIVYGKETDAAQVMNLAKRFPMMAAHQVVVVKEAQEMKSWDDLVHYLDQPLKSTLLVFNYKYKNPDKRKKVFARLVKETASMETKKLYDNQVPAWITGFVKDHKRQIDPKAAMLLTEFLGSDLSRIAREMEKLFVAMGKDQTTVTPALVERNIGISKDFNQFELQAALGKRDALKANRIIRYFDQNPKDHHISVTIGSLYYYFNKLLTIHYLKDKSKDSVAAAIKVHPFFVGEYMQAARSYSARSVVNIIALLRECDMRSKGYGGNNIPDGELQKEMVFKILHA
ncbi:MAG: DNA polymerase III subunit delta [Bacteroidales bacterium]